MRVQLAQAPTDGGFACLRMLFASHGVHVGAEQLREVSGVGRDSPNLDTVNSTAQWFGFETELRDIREFLGAHEHEALEFPMIAEWGATKARQFIVVTQVDAKSIQLIDPFVGRRTVDRLEAGRSLSGRVLSITADPDRSTFTQVPATNTLKLFVTSKSGAAFVILAGLGLIVPGIIAPGLVRIFVDDFLARGDRDSQNTILAGLFAMLVVSITLTVFQLSAMKRLNTIAVTALGARIMWHLLRMPAWFLSSRDATSLGFRVQLTQQIAAVLSGELALALMAALTSFFFLIVMFVLSPILGLVAFIGFFTVVILIWRVAPTRVEVRQRQAREREVSANLLGTSLRVLDTLKATGNENIAFDRSYSSLGRLLILGNTHLWAWMGMLPTAVMLFTSVFVLATGALLVIFGTITQGTLAVFFLLLSGFLAPLIILVPSIDSFLSLRGSLDSIDDILMQKVDPALRDPYLDTEPAPLEIYAATMSESVEPAPLEVKDSPVSEAEVEVDHLSLLMAQGGRKRGQKSGVSSGLAVDPWAASLDLVDVTFGYSRINAPLLNNITLSIKPGRVVALVGASGSGKSTVGRLVASMYQPWQGEISLDGKPLQSISQESKANDINFVNQDVVIFQASIRDNISMFNPDIPDRNIVAAAKKALIHDDIISRPGGYEAVLAQDGRDLSGGQRQRLGIARALVRNPRLLVLDEATSSLDARTEMEIVANLRAQGCTSLVIAHRLSTVRDADEIIVMDQGRIMERGTHRELALQGGPYQELMNS